MLGKVVKSGRLNNAHVDSISTSKLTLTLRNMNFNSFVNKEVFEERSKFLIAPITSKSEKILIIVTLMFLHYRN